MNRSCSASKIAPLARVPHRHVKTGLSREIRRARPERRIAPEVRSVKAVAGAPPCRRKSRTTEQRRESSLASPPSQNRGGMLGTTESSLTCIGRSHWTTNRSASSLDKRLSYLLQTLLSARRTPYHPMVPATARVSQGKFEPASHSTGSGATKTFCRSWMYGAPAYGHRSVQMPQVPSLLYQQPDFDG